MVTKFLTKSAFQTSAVTSVMALVILNAFLPLNFSLQAETTQYPFKLTTILEKTTYQLREPINITLCLENIGNENVTLHYPSNLRDIIVYDENFNKIYGYSEDRLYPDIYHARYVIKPGEVINFPETWHQSAEPGNYYVTGIFTSAYRIMLQTPAVRITII
jgi:hypothetical protein